MRSVLLLLVFVTSSLSLQAQAKDGMFLVTFTDKDGSPYSINNPEAFLSERALARRALHQSAITPMDLPLSPEYQKGVLASGAKIWLRSKWMNAVVVQATADQMEAIKKLEFVTATEYVAPKQYERTSNVPVMASLERPAPTPAKVPVSQKFYGFGWDNLTGMKGDSLHHWGFRGQGVLVAVLDGGFPNVNYKDFLGYDQEAAVPGNYDLVQQDTTALDGGSHGATVLSTMAAHHPFFYIGTAPAARYVLFKTENNRGEHRLEEINYAVALEIADSIGVDVVNSSLGYSEFSDPTMNYTKKDLDGKTSPASVATGHAFARGMIIVTSAGNSGGDDWKYVSIPADAADAFSIGALTPDGDRAYFSSTGPTADGKIKPDVSALGVNVTAVSANGRGLDGANGTSLSSPLVAGLVACLRQAVPNATNRELLAAIRATASQADAPDNNVGYGRPNFAAAYRRLTATRK